MLMPSENLCGSDLKLYFFSDQIIEEAVKCNQENDAVLLANTILVHIGVLKVINTYIYTGSVDLLSVQVY